MARPFQDKQRETVHQWLVEWAAWLSKSTDRSPLGARIGAYEMRGGTTKPPGPICPEVMRPPRLVKVETAVYCQSRLVQNHIQCYYKIIPPDNPKYAKVTPRAREYFLGRLTAQLFHQKP